MSPSESPPRILVAEDSTVQRLQIAGLLEKHGFDVRTATDGAEALHIIRSNVALPDVVLADIGMPRVNGISLCRELKGEQLTRHLPVVILTSLADERNHRTALDAGADEFLIKPVGETELIVRLESVMRLTRQNLHDELLRRQELYDAIPDAVLLCDETGHCIEANKAATQLLGYSREQLLKLDGRTLSIDGNSWFESRQHLKAFHSWRGVMQLRHRQGAAVSVEANAVTAPVGGRPVQVWVLRQHS